MQVTLVAARVYGTQSHYGEQPRVDPLGGPIIIPNFPAPGERSYVQLGAPIDWLPRANRVSRAIGVVAMTGYINPSTGSYGDVAVEEVISGGDLSSWSADDYGWYVTFLIERDIDVSETDVKHPKYVWMNPKSVLELEAEFETYSKPYLDQLAAYGSTVIESMFFENLILDDRVYFRCPSKESFGLPRWTVNSPIGIVRKGGRDRL